MVSFYHSIDSFEYKVPIFSIGNLTLGLTIFTARRYASAVLGVVILSVRHTRAL